MYPAYTEPGFFSDSLKKSLILEVVAPVTFSEKLTLNRIFWPTILVPECDELLLVIVGATVSLRIVSLDVDALFPPLSV